MKRAMLGLLASLVIAAVYGVAIEPRLIDTETWAVPIDDLPEPWEGQRVAVIADLQVGMWLSNTGTIERIAERLVDLRPSLVVIAGDFIYHPIGEQNRASAESSYTAHEIATATARVSRVIELLRPLTEADIPTYAVLGNHDYGMRSPSVSRLDWVADELTAALQKIGVRVLQNEAVALPAGASPARHPLYLVGVGSHYAGYDHPERALRGVPADAPRLMIMHHPDTFARVPPGAAPLAIAGHTHGGQIAVPYMPGWSWMNLIQDDEVHADGWIDDYGAPGNRLYVNRGIGFSVVPVRIGALPEITVFRLERPRLEGRARSLQPRSLQRRPIP